MRTLTASTTLGLAAAAVGAALLIGGRAQSGGPSFSKDQVTQGQQAYAKSCSSCHGSDLGGGAGPALKGSGFMSKWSGKPLSNLHDYISHNMPQNAPGSLPDDEYLAITAYVLAQNGYQPGGTKLSKDNMSAQLTPPQGGGAAGGGGAGGNGGGGSSQGSAGAKKQQVPKDLPKVMTQGKEARGKAPTQDELLNAADRDDWLMYNKDYRGQRYAKQSEITAQNAAEVRPLCALQLGETGAFQPGPIVYNGIMYVTTAHNTYALNATNCQRYWKSSYSPSGPEPFNTNRGVAIYGGKLFRGTTDGHLLALDLTDGKVVWDTWVADSGQGYFLSSAPIVWRDLVFIGEAGADWGVKARMWAFSANTGKVAWKFDVIPTGKEKGADSWQKDTSAAHGGGSMWTSYALDPGSGMLYVPVGNPAPDFAGGYRPGANLFTNSMVVLAAASGKLQWYQQQIQNDYHDWDTAAAPVVYDAGGKKLVAIANKGGHLFIYDRGSHESIAKVPVTTIKNAEKPLTTEGTYFCPGTVGGVEWNGPAYDPKQGALYVNAVDWCVTLKLGQVRYQEGQVYTGAANGFGTFDPLTKAGGWTTAINASNGKVLWKRKSGSPLVAGITPTAGGVVLTADMDGNFLILNSKDGKDLYSFNTGGAVGGGVISYAVGGRQYVAVASGNSSRSTWKSEGSATVYVFGLGKGTSGSTPQGGTAKTPPASGGQAAPASGQTPKNGSGNGKLTTPGEAPANSTTGQPQPSSGGSSSNQGGSGSGNQNGSSGGNK